MSEQFSGSRGGTGIPACISKLKGLSHINRWWLLLPVVLLLIQVSAAPNLEADSVHYLSMAQSLVDHGKMLRLGEPHLIYAVGYPTLLSGTLTFHVNPFLTSSFLNAVLGLIFLAGVWQWSRQVAPRQAVWISCLVLCNATVLYLYRRPLSEPLFMALLIWCTVFLNHAVRQLPGRIDWLALTAASVLMCMLVATRQVGVFLGAGLATWLASLLWRGTIHWKQALVTACLPGIMAGVTLLALIHHDQQTKVYAPMNSNWDMLLRKSDFCADHKEETLSAYLLEGVRIRLYETGRLLIPGMFGCYAKTGQWLNVNTLIFVPVAALCFFGWWRLVRRRGDALLMMFPWYFALYVYWPSDQGGRFFAPILCILFLSLWKGLVLFPRLRTRWTPVALICLHTLVALGLWIFVDLRNYHRLEREVDDMSYFAHKLMEETGQLGVEDSAAWISLYMSHLLDRALVNYNPAEPPRHLLWPADKDLPPGYVEASAGRSYRLARYEMSAP